jgi:hypothetical protein
MKKSLKPTTVHRKAPQEAKRPAVAWSKDRAAALRKASSFPTGGDCNCNCK